MNCISIQSNLLYRLHNNLDIIFLFLAGSLPSFAIWTWIFELPIILPFNLSMALFAPHSLWIWKMQNLYLFSCRSISWYEHIKYWTCLPEYQKETGVCDSSWQVNCAEASKTSQPCQWPHWCAWSNVSIKKNEVLEVMPQRINVYKILIASIITLNVKV